MPLPMGYSPLEPRALSSRTLPQTVCTAVLTLTVVWWVVYPGWIGWYTRVYGGREAWWVYQVSLLPPCPEAPLRLINLSNLR